MKKFTKIEENLLKESTEASKRLEMHYKQSVEKLGIIKSSLDDMMNDFKGPEGLNQKNWGFVGSMAEINSKLDDIMEFLGVKDIRDDSTKYNL